jgi:hypothetical protein
LNRAQEKPAAWGHTGFSGGKTRTGVFQNAGMPVQLQAFSTGNTSLIFCYTSSALQGGVSPFPAVQPACV